MLAHLGRTEEARQHQGPPEAAARAVPLDCAVKSEAKLPGVLVRIGVGFVRWDVPAGG